MTLSLLMYVLMIITLAPLAGVLVVDAVRGLWLAPARRGARAAGRADRRAASSRAPSHGAASTTS
jgi:hypothetical protein